MKHHISVEEFDDYNITYSFLKHKTYKFFLMKLQINKIKLSFFKQINGNFDKNIVN